MDRMGLTAFHCPLCDVLTCGELHIEVESLLAYHHLLVEVWPGGPQVEDPFGPVVPIEVDQLLRTSACSCAFPWSSWSWEVHVTPGLAELVVTARPE